MYKLDQERIYIQKAFIVTEQENKWTPFLTNSNIYRFGYLKA